MILTSLGVCRNHVGLLLPPKAMKPGTPAGMQLWLGGNAILPASTSSLSFFITSFTHGFRFGFLRSAIRQGGCRPLPLGTNGYFGSLVSGGTLPGTGRNSPIPIHPTVRSQEKAGGVACACASTGTAHAPARAITMLPASVDLRNDVMVRPS